MPEVKLGSGEPKMTDRQKAKAARLQAIADNTTVRTVQVWPASDALARVLKHPNGTGFRGGAKDPIDWPYDSFTHRRILEGSVLLGGAPSSARAEPDSSKSPREQAAARRPKPESVPPMEPISAQPPEQQNEQNQSEQQSESQA